MQAASTKKNNKNINPCSFYRNIRCKCSWPAAHKRSAILVGPARNLRLINAGNVRNRVVVFPFCIKKRVVLQIVKGVGQLFEVIFASKEAEIIKRK